MVTLFAVACALPVFAWRPWQSRAIATADSVLTVPTTASQTTNDSRESAEPEPSAEPLAETSIASIVDSKPSVIGFWRDDFYGKRIFEFREDGTATMVIELDAIGKALYGPQLKFFIDWKIEDNVLKLKMTGGEPASAFTAAKIFGESSEQRIESVEVDEMRLRSLDSNKLYTHRRVAGWE